MEQSPWECNKFSASQEIPCTWNPKVHYLIYHSSPPLTILSQINPVHAPRPTSWRSILILSSHLRVHLLSGLFPSGFPTKTQYACLFSTYACYMPCLSHSSRFDHPNNIPWGVQIIKLFLHSPVTSSLLGPSILLNTLFSNTLRLLSSLNVGDKGSRPFKTTGKMEFCIS